MKTLTRVFQMVVRTTTSKIHFDRHKWLAVVTTCLLCFTSGCSDLNEVDNLNIVIAIGVDQVSPTEIRVTEEIPKIEKTSGGQQAGAGGSPDSILRSQTGPTFAAALRELEYDVPHTLYLPHNAVVIFGDAYARQGLDRALDYLERDKNYRRNQLLVVTRGSAQDVLSTEPAPLTLHAQAIRMLVAESTREHRTINSEQLKFVREFLTPPSVAEIAAVEASQNHTLLSDGVGLVSQGRLVNYLSRDQTQLLALLQGQRGFASMTIPCPPENTQKGGDNRITFDLTQISTTLTPTYDGNKVHFRIAIHGRASLVRVCHSQKLDPKHVEQLQTYIDQYITNAEQGLLDQLAQQNIDAANLGGVIYRRWPGLWHRVESRWYKDMKSEVDTSCDVKIQIIRVGLSSDSPLSELSEQALTPKSGVEEKVQ